MKKINVIKAIISVALLSFGLMSRLTYGMDAQLAVGIGQQAMAVVCRDFLPHAIGSFLCGPSIFSVGDSSIGMYGHTDKSINGLGSLYGKTEANSIVVDEAAQAALIDAIKSSSSSPSMIRELSNKPGTSLHAIDKDGMTLLMTVIKTSDYTEEIDALLGVIDKASRYEFISAPNQNGYTPFMEAAKRDYSSWLDTLASYVPSDKSVSDLINRADKDGMTALMYAAESGRVVNVGGLLNPRTFAADVNAVNNQGQAALTLAINNMKYEVVELLVKQGAVIRPTEELVMAIRHKEFEKAGQLLNEGVVDLHFVNKDGDTLLTLAATHGAFLAVERLLAAGVDVHAANVDGQTARDCTRYIKDNKARQDMLDLLAKYELHS